LIGKPEGRDHAEDLGKDGKILEWNLGKVQTGFIWRRVGTGGRFL